MAATQPIGMVHACDRWSHAAPTLKTDWDLVSGNRDR